MQSGCSQGEWSQEKWSQGHRWTCADKYTYLIRFELDFFITFNPKQANC